MIAMIGHFALISQDTSRVGWKRLVFFYFFYLNNVSGIREGKAGALSVGGQHRVGEGVVYLKSLAKNGKHFVVLSLDYEKHLVDQQPRRC